MIELYLALSLLSCQSGPGEWVWKAQIASPAGGSLFSWSIASMRDLDADGVRDLIVGDPDAVVGSLRPGGAIVCSGKSGSLLFAFPGENDSGQFGVTVAAAGDVDSDGLEDILIGAPSASYLGQWLGAAYVYSGRDGHLIHRIIGGAADLGEQGRAVSGFTDWDQDGFDDFLVSDENDAVIPGASGVVRLYSGRDASVLMLIGASGTYGIGGRVRAIQDLTGDGLPEILVSVGGAVVVHSGADGSEVRRHLSQLSNDQFGSALAGLGDLDQDGAEDYVIGAPAFGSNRNGRAYVYSGAGGTRLFEFKGQQLSGSFGWSAAGPGDTDGDGFGEILIGAWEENWTAAHGSTGAAHLYSGFDGSHMETFTGDASEAHLIGISVADTGDVNEDGLSDLAIGSGSANHAGTGAGVVRTYALHSYLNLGPRSVSAAAGGTIGFQLDFPDADAGKKYVLLGSGGVPGRTLVLDHWLPVARTPLLDLMVHHPPSFISGAHGTLNAQGDAAAFAIFAPNQSAAWIGRTIKFVAVSFDAPLDISLYSAAMTLTIEP